MSSKRHPTAGSLGINYFKLSRLKKSTGRFGFVLLRRVVGSKSCARFAAHILRSKKKDHEYFPALIMLLALKLNFV